jgi:PST family polysaccharide transporter
MSTTENHVRASVVQAPPGFIGKGSAITLTGQGTKILVQLMSTAVLGRLLMPADFGMMGTVGPLLTFFVVFRDLGLTNVAVQRPDISHQEVSNLFWINVGAGCVLGLVVASLGPSVALFYRDDRLAAIVAFLASTFVINGISAQHFAVMQRRFNIVRLVSIDVGSTAVGIAVGIAAAFFGCGYWSLAIIPVVTQALSMLLATATSSWWPGRPRWHSEMIGLIRSGGGYAGFNLFNFLSRNLDQILIGRTLGETTLGYYSRAYNLMLLPLSQVTNPLAQVMMPTLSRLVDDPPAYRAAYLGTVRRVMFLCCPLVMANVVGADWAVGLLLGPKWTPTVGIYAALGISALVQPVGNSTGWLFISQGRARDMFLWGIFSSVVVALSFLVGLQWGVLGLAWSYTLVQFLIISPALWYWVGRHGPVLFRDLAGSTLPFLLVSAVDAALFLLLRGYWDPPPVVGLLGAIGWHISAQTALLALHPSTRPMIAEMISLLRRCVIRAATTLA